MNFLKSTLKGVLGYLKDPKFIIAVTLVIILFVPLLVKLVFKIPGAKKASDAIANAVPLIALALGLYFLTPDVHAAPGGNAAQLIQSAPVTHIPDGATPLIFQKIALGAIVSTLTVGVLFVLFYAGKHLKCWRFNPAVAAILAAVTLGVVSAFAVPPNVYRNFTSVVIRPATGAVSEDTNGTLRLYSANGSNFIMVDTNCNLLFFTSVGWKTGVTAVQSYTNGAATRSSNTLFSGIIIATDGSSITPQ